MVVSQRPFDPYQAGAEVYRAYRAGGRPAPQTTLTVVGSDKLVASLKDINNTAKDLKKQEMRTVKVGVPKKVVFTRISTHISVSNKSIFKIK
jgi:hypothetical protein